MDGAQRINQVVYCLRYPHFQNVQDSLDACKNIMELGKILSPKCTAPNPKDIISHYAEGSVASGGRGHLEQVLFTLIALYLGTQDGGTGSQCECQA